MVELAVHDASTSTHSLHIAGWNALHVAHAVLMGEFAREHVADDFHVAVTVLAEAGPRRHAVFVDYPQVAPAHVGRVVIASKRERVVALEPAMIRVAAVLRFAQSEHQCSSLSMSSIVGLAMGFEC